MASQVPTQTLWESKSPRFGFDTTLLTANFVIKQNQPHIPIPIPIFENFDDDDDVNSFAFGIFDGDGDPKVLYFP